MQGLAESPSAAKAPPFTDLPDLASSRLGARVLAANDDFFAPKENLIKPEPAVFIKDKYTSRGKWMDGWETRRRRAPGHDWCLLRLGCRGTLRGVDVDTSHFLGNYPEHCSIEACDLPVGASLRKLEAASWTEILPKSPLKGGTHNLLAIGSATPCSFLRLRIYPDGGVARLRAYGEVVPDFSKSRGLIDLASVLNGGWVTANSDRFFGSPGNMLMPGRARNMGDGWETKRRRGPGHDWAIVRLGAAGRIQKVELDTNHFKGNYPDACSLEGGDGSSWTEILPRTKLRPHTRHFFQKEITHSGPFSQVRINIYPDGGVSRLRIYGLVGPVQ